MNQSALNVITDIDECALEVDRCEQNCHNMIGSYMCDCGEGYIVDDDGLGCEGGYGILLAINHIAILCLFPSDIDECGDGSSNCEHMCNNTVGSYLCSCYPGYLLTNNSFSCQG